MLHAIEAVLPMFVTLMIGYAAAAYHRFEPAQTLLLSALGPPFTHAAFIALSSRLGSTIAAPSVS
jgi:hypothetical protein